MAWAYSPLLGGAASLPGEGMTVIDVPLGQYTLTGHAPEFRLIKPPTGSYTLTGHTPTILYRPKKITYVGGQVASSAGTTSAWAAIPFNLTGGINSVPQEGDLVVVCYAITSALARSPTPALSAPSGWTASITYPQGGASQRLTTRTFYKFMTSTPDTSITPAATGNVDDAGVISIRVYRGVNPTTPMDISQGSTSFTGNTPPDDVPNPPGATPVTRLATIVSFGSQGGPSVATFTAPAELDSGTFQTVAQADTNAAAIGSGHYMDWNAGEIDIGPYGGGTSSASNIQTTNTIVLRPAGVTVGPATGAYTFTGYAPTISISRTVTVPLGTYALTGYAPTLTEQSEIAPPAGTYTLTGYAPSITRALTINAPAGSYTLTGQTPTLPRSITVSAPAGSYALTGYAPTLTTARLLNAVVGTYAQTGYAPSLTRSLRVEPPAGSYALTGLTPALTRALRINAPLGTFSLTGNAPTTPIASYDVHYIGGQVDRQKGRTSSWPPITFSLTGGLSPAPQKGDLVLVFYAIASNPGRTPEPTIVSPTDYTAGTTLRATGSNFVISGRYFWKIMGDTPDTEITFSQTFDVRDPGAIAIRVYRNVDPAVFDVTPATMTGTGTTAGQDKPNPAAVTPTTAGAVIVAFGAQGTTTAADFTAPAELDAATFQSITETDTVDVTIGAGDYFDWTSGAYDIGIFGGGVSATGNAQLAFTIALRLRVKDTTLSAPVGSFSLTGHAPTLPISRTLSAPLGTFTLTGYAPTLTLARRIDAGTGTYVLTGYSPTLTRSLVLNVPVGSYALTGHAPDIQTASTVAPPAGAYTLTGNAPTLPTARILSAVSGSYALTGHAPAITRALTISPPAGSYSLIGYAPTIQRSTVVNAPAGSYSLTGQTPALIRALAFTPPVGTYALTGYAPSLTRALRIEAPLGAYALTGNAPTLTQERQIAPPVGAFTLTGYAPALTRAARVEAPAGAYALTGHAPSVLRSFRIEVPAGAYSLTGNTPTLDRGITLSAPAGAYNLTGYAPALLLARRIAPQAGAYALTGFAPSLTRSLILSPPAGAYALSGLAPSILRGNNVDAPLGEFDLTGYPPALVVARRVDAPSGAFALTLIPPTIARLLRMDVPAGSYVFSGHAPSFPPPYIVTSEVKVPPAQTHIHDFENMAGPDGTGSASLDNAGKDHSVIG